MKKSIIIAAVIILIVFVFIKFKKISEPVEKVRAGDTHQTKIGIMKASLSIYFGDKMGDRPEKLEELVPEYLEKIPTDPYLKKDTVIVVKGKPEGLDKEDPSFITGGGGWVYFPETGDIFLNVQGKNTAGELYWKRGQN